MNSNNKQKTGSASNDYDLMLKGKVKLDPTTALERFFLTGIWACPFMFFMGCILAMGFKSAIFLPALFLGFFGFIPSIVFYFLADNYYILDTEHKTLFYRFKFFTYESVTSFAKFADIHAVTMKSKKATSSGSNRTGAKRKRQTFWYYQILLVLSSGKVVPVTKLEQKVFEKEEKLAKQISQTTGAEFVQHFSSKTSNPCIAKKTDGKYTFNHPSNTTLSGGLNVSRSTLNVVVFIIVFLVIPLILKFLNII